MKILCALGKYAYGDPSRDLSPEYASFIPALKRLGHDVIHFELWDRRQYANFAELNLSLLQTVVKESPEVMLTVQLNYEIWLETLDVIRALGNVTTICWTTDDSWKYREVSRFIGNSYHAMTTTYEDKIRCYHRDGVSRVLLTQWAASVESMRESIPASKCRYHVSFIGAAHGNRTRRIEDLRRYGIKVSCFGYGWPSGPVKADEIPAIMQQSIINLNFANAKGPNQIKARTFEVPGAGGFLLTEYAPGLERFYRIGKEIETFRQTGELVRKIEYYISHTEKRDVMAKAGFERTWREHTYDKRLQQVLDYATDSHVNIHAHDIEIALQVFIKAVKLHSPNYCLTSVRRGLLICCNLIWGKVKGPRAARRLVFELSWRLMGKKTYTAGGLPGRLFPDL